VPRLAHTRRRGFLALIACFIAVGVATTAALATVTLYSNDLGSKHKARELTHNEGNHCEKEWMKKREVVQITVLRGPERCGYSPPVMADGHLPDTGIAASMKLSKKTRKAARKHSYLALEVRRGKKQGYEMRVYPRTRDCSLRRSPHGGPFPVDCSSAAIQGVNKHNTLRLQVFGRDVKAFVNGALVANVNDPNPDEVGGRKTELAVGNTARSKRDAVGLLDHVKVFCANGGC